MNPENETATGLAPGGGGFQATPISAREDTTTVGTVHNGGKLGEPLSDQLKRELADDQRLHDKVLPADTDPVDTAIKLATVSGPQTPDSDLANAYRIVTHYADRLLFVEGMSWFVFEAGGPWRYAPQRAREIVMGISRRIMHEVADVAALLKQFFSKAEIAQIEKAIAALTAWARQSEFEGRNAAALSMAQPMLYLPADKLDADPDLLGVANGVIDLRTFEHRPHRQADHISKTCGCGFDASATAPTWEAFITEVLGGDPSLISYIQRLVGYTLTGHRGEHLLPIFWGGGANGKSTLLGALQAMLGDYAGTAAPDLLLQRGGTEHPTGVADLQGRRLVIGSETGEAGRLNEERTKLLTGGDQLMARRMRQDFFKFMPTHQIVMQTNHKPKANGTDLGLWRRLKLIPFTVTIPAERRDAKLPEKLRAELPGILNWCLAGLRAYQQDGFQVPAAVEAATAAYRDDSDQLAGFLADCCVVGPKFTSTARDLFIAYTAWCDQNGERARSQKDLGTRMGERGFKVFRGTAGVRRYQGVGIASSDASDVSDVDSGMSDRYARTRDAHTELSVTRVTHVTADPATAARSPAQAPAYESATAATADDYRRGRDPG